MPRAADKKKAPAPMPAGKRKAVTRDHTMTLRLTAEENEKVEAATDADKNISKADVLRQLIRDHL